MPDNFQPKFEALERDIERLSKEVKEHKEKGALPEKPDIEVLKSVIASRIAQQQPPPSEPQESDILPKYLQNEPAEIKLKVEELVDMAFRKGIDISIEEAKKSGPFVLDAFHDALTAKLYDELKARKII